MRHRKLLLVAGLDKFMRFIEGDDQLRGMLLSFILGIEEILGTLYKVSNRADALICSNDVYISPGEFLCRAWSVKY